MKKLLVIMSMVTLAVGFAMADGSKGAKPQAKKDDCCAVEAKVKVKKDDCCEKEAKAAKKGDCCGSKPSAEDAFMAEARKMAMSAEGKQECCKSTPAKPVAKGEEGCCNAKGEVAKFKVFVAGHGYKYFGCEGSASKGRKELLAKGARVGKVQKVATKVTM